MEEKIQTLHPEGKAGVNIDRAKYETVKAAIAGVLRAGGDVTFADLTRQVENKLAGNFDGSAPWYVTTVKLDLEARGVIERVSKSSPQRIRLAGQ